MAFYASRNPEHLPCEIRNFYKDSFKKLCNELLVDVWSEVDQLFETEWTDSCEKGASSLEKKKYLAMRLASGKSA